MSKIQGKPFIELVVDTLGDLKTDFLDLVNGSDKTPEFRSLINASAKITGSDKGKVQYVVLETWSKTYTGYLIYNNTYCVLVAFSSNTQALTMLKIDVAKQTFTTVKEYLDINELRRYLEEASEHITSGEIDSGEAEANALLVADGDGGTEFVSPEDGSAQYLLGLDSEGNIIKDEIPEGIVVDQTIVEDSENAVAGGAVYDALQEVGSDISDINVELEQKANVDGNYPTMTVGAADNLTPYDEDSGVNQEQPFLLQGTGCGNGEQQVDTGALGLLKEKQGNTVVVNQLLDYAAGSYSDSGIDIVTDTNGVYTITGTATADFYTRFASVSVHLGHKSLIWYDTVTPANNSIRIGDFNNGYSVLPNKIAVIYEPVVNTSFGISIKDGTTVNLKIKPRYIDLTQWFGSNDNIPAHLLAHPEDFFRYYQGSLAYNTGELVNANGRYLKTIGRNQWDEEWEQGAFDIIAGANMSGSGIRSKNLIKVIPGAIYNGYVNHSGSNIWAMFYDKDMNIITPAEGTVSGNVLRIDQNTSAKIPSNAVWCKFYVTDYGTTYNHDITISIYYDGESGYDQYYPYEELANIDTGTEVLRGAGSVKDTKAPDGTITHNVGSVDLSTLSWTQYATNKYVAVAPNNVKLPQSDAHKINGVSSKYEIVIAGANFDNYDFVLAVNSIGEIYCKDTSGSPTGTLYYELATPTTEQGTTFSENIVIDDFGSMDFSGTSGVPQGASIFYAVDYKAFVDSLYNTLDGDATDIVKESGLDSKLATLGYVKLTSVSGYDATKTQVLKNVEGTLTWVTEE